MCLWSSVHVCTALPLGLNQMLIIAQTCVHVKILTPSLVCSRVMGPLSVILLLFLVLSSIIPLTIHYQPLSIPFWSVRLLVLLINIVTLGSSSINYDFILTSYYPSNGCFTQKLSIPDYYIIISYFIILYMFHFYLGIILSFVLCTLVLKINLVSPILLLLSSLGFSPLIYWGFPSYTSEIGTTGGSGGTAHKLRLKSYWLH